MKKQFKQIILASFNAKDAKNSLDYRGSLLMVCTWLIQNQPNHFAIEILLTHAKIQEILYQLDVFDMQCF